MLFQSISRNALILGAFALLSIGLIAVFHHLTKDKIKAEMQAKLARTLNELVAASEYNNDVYHDCAIIDSNGVLHPSESSKVYRMTNNGQPVALVFTITAPDGYNGKINLIMAVRPNGQLAGVRTLSHNETPGLGDKIDTQKSDWIKQFSGLSLDQPPVEQWKVKQDGGVFDAFTGATITPRAVVRALARGLEFANSHALDIHQASNACGASNE